MRVVALSDALQLRRYLRLVLFRPRVARRYQRVATYVCLIVVLHHAIYDLPPLLARAAYGVEDLVIDISSHPLLDGGVSERDIMGYVFCFLSHDCSGSTSTQAPRPSITFPSCLPSA